MRALISTSIVFLILLGFTFESVGQEPTQGTGQEVIHETPSCTLTMTLDGAVAPGFLDYFDRGLREAKRQDCASILLSINTPGGNLQTTREIVQRILASPVPVLCLISPSGGRAGSAGAIIMMGCHVSGALPATNIGAATPISGSGQAIEDDLKKKLIEDTVSWVTGLAHLRSRNADFAKQIVTDAKSLEGEEAAKIQAIDALVPDLDHFLKFAEGREVKLSGDQVTAVRIGALTPFDPDLRSRVLSFFTDPQIAYLLFMASLALLYFELSQPGLIVPGVLGGIGLLLSLIAFHQLDVWWGGVFLIALGLALLIAEAFVPSFGALGIGGIAALGFGSFLLYDPAVVGWRLPLATIIITSLVLGGIVLLLGLVALRSRSKGKAQLEVTLLGKSGEVLSLEAPSLQKGMIVVDGEYWRFKSDKDVHIGDRVKVLSQEDLLLYVTKES